MEPNQDGTEVLETTVETVEETVETPAERTAEQLAELEVKAAKVDELEEKNKQLYERAKKAEAKAPLKKENSDINRDLLYLAKADIHEDDTDIIIKYARDNKMSLSEAHKFMKPILDVNAEQRRTAAATHTKGGARGTSKVSGEDLLAAASRGEDIELDDEKANELFKARLARKISKVKRNR